MKKRVALLLCLLSVWGALTNTETDAAKREVFQPLVPEEQTVAWLKERNHDAEDLGNGRYRIYWRDYSGDNLRDEYGDLYSIRTFDWGPRGNIALVVVSSRVKWVKTGNRTTPDTGLPEYRYDYSIASLETSQQPVDTLWIRTPDLPRNWERAISNPEGWKNYGQPHQREKANNGVTWSANSKIPLLAPGTFQSGFTFKCRSLPSIIMADIWASGGDGTGHEAVAIPSYVQTAPRGPVIGPVAVPVGTSVSELTRRLEMLISQSVELGWLDASAAVPLKQQLANSLTALGKNQQSAAKRAIRAFVSALEELGESATANQRDEQSRSSAEAKAQLIQEPVIIEEALTLLKTNAEYLLTRF